MQTALGDTIGRMTSKALEPRSACLVDLAVHSDIFPMSPGLLSLDPTSTGLPEAKPKSTHLEDLVSWMAQPPFFALCDARSNQREWGRWLTRQIENTRALMADIAYGVTL